MSLHFVSREDYKSFREDPVVIANEFPGHLIIPEGGSGGLGVKGAEEIMQFMNKNDFTHVACAIGTGTTFCGLVNGSAPEQIMIGIPVLKGLKDLENQFSKFLRTTDKISRCRFFYDYHFGGYAKYTSELINFMSEFYRQTNIPSDFVYTGKLFFAINDLIEKNFFPKDSRVLVIHSGGLQGNRSLSKGTLIF
jgi:1-aminocyclopropane-1-carboxylate deaminase